MDFQKELGSLFKVKVQQVYYFLQTRLENRQKCCTCNILTISLTLSNENNSLSNERDRSISLSQPHDRLSIADPAKARGPRIFFTKKSLPSVYRER